MQKVRSLCLPSLIRAKESFTAEMDDVAWCLGDPDFGFPCDLGEVIRHGPAPEPWANWRPSLQQLIELVNG